MLIIAVALFVLSKSIQTKKYRWIPLCIVSLLYVVALTLYNYPLGVSENYVYLTKWFEHTVFVLLIVSVFFASSAKAVFAGTKMRLPRVLACIAAVVRIVRAIFGRYVLSERYISSLTPENIADIMRRNAYIGANMFGVISLISLIILIYFTVKVCKEKTDKQRNVKTSSQSCEKPSQ